MTRTLTALLAGIAMAACAQPQGGGAPGDRPSAAEARWTVGPARVECVGVAPAWCLMVRDTPDGPWRRHFGPIDGLRFVPGDEVDLAIRFEPIANPPADAPNRRTVAVRELARRTLPGTPLPDALGGTAWRLAELGGTPLDASARGPVTMAFDAAGQVAGFAGVNRYTSRVGAGAGWIRIAPGITTRMAGPPEAMRLESDVLGRVQAAALWRIDGDRLSLSDADGRPLMTLRREGAAVSGRPAPATGVPPATR
ncbi:MAG: META domain-containing protein [Burkholderiales bacterium]